MASERITKVFYRHTCERPQCRYVWESEGIPGTCANPKCRSKSWNKPRRREVKQEGVSLHSIVQAD